MQLTRPPDPGGRRRVRRMSRADRMIQFREKSGTQTRLSLLTYPVLMAAEPGYVRDVLTVGAQRARSRCEATVRRAKEAIGLLTYSA
jgi:hypothetical protein